MQPTAPIIIQKRNTSGTFVVTLIIALAVIFFLLIPKFKVYSQNKAANAVAKETLDAAEQQKNEVDALYIQINNQKSDLAKIDLAIPDRPDTSSIYALMESMAKSANLSLTSIQAKDDYAREDGGKEEDAAPFPTSSISQTLGTITVNMQMSGTIDSFVQLLTALEQSLRLIDVQSIDVSREKEASALIFRVTLKTYYQR